MTNEDLDKLAQFTERAVKYLQSVEIKQDAYGRSQIIFETARSGEKVINKFLVAAPINIACLVAEVRRLNDFVDKVLESSMKEDGESGVGETTKMLHEFVDGRQSVGTTEDPESLMKGGADA